MRVLQAVFMEPIESPVQGNGGGMIEKFRDNPSAPGPLRCRAQGPGLLLEVADKPRACIIPWGNVRYVMVEVEEGDAKPAAKK